MANAKMKTPIGNVDVPSFIQREMDAKSDEVLKAELIGQINANNGFIDPHLIAEVEHRKIHVPELYSRGKKSGFENVIDQLISDRK
jgi:hypothetical protein